MLVHLSCRHPVQELPDQSAAANALPCHPSPILGQACRHGHMPTVRLLLRRGADAGLGDVRGDTPAHLAARHGHLDLLAELLQAGGRLGKSLCVRGHAWANQLAPRCRRCRRLAPPQLICNSPRSAALPSLRHHPSLPPCNPQTTRLKSRL